jgi:TusA-related sulfurtransferase
MPLIRVQDRIKTLHEGEVLEVVCTDPGTLNDIPAWCRINRHELMETRRQGGEIIFTIRTGPGR